MKQYDFSALSAPLSAQDINRVPKRIAVSKPGFLYWSLLILAFIIVVLVTAGVGTPGVLFSVFMLAGLILFIYIGGLLAHKRLAKLYKFADANGLTFQHDIPPSGLNGMMFDEGHTREIRELLSFPDGIEMGTLEYITGSGKNRTTHTVGYVKVALSRHLPNMVLDAKFNNVWEFSSLPDSFDRSQRLELEGDFNKYFDLYVPKQYERDALYVFTPDVMQALIDRGRTYDMEIVNNELYFYTQARIELASEVGMKWILDMVNTISGELRQQSRRYSDERVANNNAGTAVATAGQKLKKGFNPFFIVIILLVLLHFLLQFIPAILGTM